MGRRIRELRELDPAMRKRQKILRAIPKFTGATKKRGLQFVQERLSTMAETTKLLQEYRKRAGKWPQDKDYVAEAMRDGSHWWAQYNAAVDSCIKIKEMYSKKIRKAEREGKKATLSRKRLRDVSKVCGSPKIKKNPLSKAKADFERTIGDFAGCLCPKPGARDPLLSMIELLQERKGRPGTFAEARREDTISGYAPRLLPRRRGRPSQAMLRQRAMWLEEQEKKEREERRREEARLAPEIQARERAAELRLGRPTPRSRKHFMSMEERLGVG